METNKSIELKGKVSAWLQTQGYPLEMKVAKAARLNGTFQVRQGWHYLDADTTVSRETDVVLTVSDHYGLVEINFVIECKSSNKPWILFLADNVAESYSTIHSFGFFTEEALNAIFEIKEYMFDVKRDANSSEKNTPKRLLWNKGCKITAYNLTQAFDGNSDAPYAATMSSIKAALWLSKNSFWSGCGPKFAISIPIVVTSSTLFSCYLNKTNESQLDQIQNGKLFSTQFINGEQRGVNVYITTEDYIEKLIHECQLQATELMNIFNIYIKKHGAIELMTS